MRIIIKFILITFICVFLSSCHSNKNKTYHLKNPCYNSAAQQFLRWDNINGKPSKGLLKRREEEMQLFLSGCDDERKTTINT